MNDFTIAMALVDYIPVAFFAAAAIILMGDLYSKMSKGAFALFASGAIMITIAGALKATWKLLYAAKICDFAALNSMFFPTQSIGFLLAGVGILLMLLQDFHLYYISPEQPVTLYPMYDPDALTLHCLHSSFHLA